MPPITNIVAYLPFLILTGSTGQFIYSLPVVLTCSLVASRLVSWTFIPLLGYYLLRGRGEPTIAERKATGFGAVEQAMTVSVLSGHRRVAPYGMAGGAPGSLGSTWVERVDGSTTRLSSADSAEVGPGDVLVVHTPGGGGYGAPA